MPKVSDVFASEFLRASQFTDQHVTMIIVTRPVVEIIGRPPTEKLILDLREPTGRGPVRRLGMNKRNSLTLADAFGDDTDGWLNQVIELWSEPTTFDDKPTMGIVVGPARNGAGGTAIVVPPAPTWDAPRGGDLNDEIPI